MDHTRKACKKICIMCYNSPENILVLACDHTVCLQCAYVAMTHRSSDLINNDIEFDCVKCREVTYFDKELIKQIEVSIQSQTKKRNYQRDAVPKNGILQKQKLHRGESFIEKMRNQYFSQKPLVPLVNQNSKLSQNQYQNFETKIKNTISFEKQFPSYKNTDNDQSFAQFNKNHNLNNNKVSSKIQMSDFKLQKEISKKNSQQTKCKSHPYYELIYFCMNCREVVCPQCLLRGEHKNHKNQSISQILEQELPDFINRVSQKMYQQVSQIQVQKQENLNQINKKFNQIRLIRQNAELYFIQVRKNLQKQQKQVLEKCDQLLNNLKSQEIQNQLRQKELETSFKKNIQEIKQLESFYQEFSDYEQCDTSRKGIEKSLIHKYLNCLKSMDSFLTQYKPQNFLLHEHQVDQQQIKYQTSIANESQLLNKRIQDGIKSIRQSLVFDNFSKPINCIAKQDRKQPSQYQSRMTKKLQQFQEKDDVRKKQSQHNEYISYISTQNSQSKSKQISRKSRQKSASISPYKGQISRQKIQLKKSIFPYKKPMFRETVQLGKENVLIQEGPKEVKTELSTQNASAIKSQIRKEQKTRQNSKQKSKNTSVTKNKKRNSIPHTNSIVNRFKV